MGGIGKTALGLRVAHKIADDYKDAQIFLDLKGTTEPLSCPGHRPPCHSLLRADRGLACAERKQHAGRVSISFARKESFAVLR